VGMGTAVGAGVGSGVGLGPGSNPEVPLPIVPVGLGVGVGGRGVELGTGVLTGTAEGLGPTAPAGAGPPELGVASGVLPGIPVPITLGVAPWAALPAVPGWLEAWAVRAGPVRPELAAVPRLWSVAVGVPPLGVGTDNLGNNGKLVGTRPLTHSVTPRPTSG
jgi:hypothetical protein